MQRPAAQHRLTRTEMRQGQPVEVATFIQFRKNEDGRWEIEAF